MSIIKRCGFPLPKSTLLLPLLPPAPSLPAAAAVDFERWHVRPLLAVSSTIIIIIIIIIITTKMMGKSKDSRRTLTNKERERSRQANRQQRGVDGVGHGGRLILLDLFFICLEFFICLFH
jgi:hypothetical protein